MATDTSILTVMVHDHGILQKLLDDVEKNISQGGRELSKSFHAFEWALEKHLFTEEKAIFTFYDPDDVTQGYKMLPEITKQHNVLLNKLSLLRQDIRKKRSPLDIDGFKEYLERHRIFEEHQVYPALDTSLSDSEKKIIIDKIKQITLK